MTYQADEMVAVTTIFVGSIPFINVRGPINQPEKFRFESVNAAIRQGYPLKIVEVEAVEQPSDEVARQASAAEAERVAQETAAKKAEEDAAKADAIRQEAEKKAAQEAAAKKAQANVVKK